MASRRAGGGQSPIDSRRRLLRQFTPDSAPLHLSFRDVVSGNFRYADVQGRPVIIGLTAPGIPGTQFLDSSRALTPGTELQARAVSSLLVAPLTPLPSWLVALLCAGLAAVAVWIDRLWGFVLAVMALALTALLWPLNILLPGVTLSFAGIIGAAAVALETSWLSRRGQPADALTRLGNRAAFTRAMEMQWPPDPARPLGLLLTKIDYEGILDRQGYAAAEEALQLAAAVLQREAGPQQMYFRWGPGECAALLSGASAEQIRSLSAHIETQLHGLHLRGEALEPSVGWAVSRPEMTDPAKLIEEAGRQRSAGRQAT
ncbi:diguanylate cyclase domain-containing protein [Deinococcus lacus]|uniref:Diguanylate cyclase domain-containing protein n=1 Tax=Deinococcus lacus TaxID=392561 RepID=A0ABW1YD00_9DEIO